MDNSSQSQANLALEARVLGPWAETFVDKYSIDPITIAVIIQAIVAVLRLINDCRKRNAWPGTYKLRRNPAMRRLIKFTLMRELGLWNYQKFGEFLIDELSREDINEIHRVLTALPHLSNE